MLAPRRNAPSSTVARALLDRVADGAELNVDGALDLLRAMLPAYGALFDGEQRDTCARLAGPQRRPSLHRQSTECATAARQEPSNLLSYGFGKPTPAGLRLRGSRRGQRVANVPERYLEISKSGGGVVQGDGDGTVPLFAQAQCLGLSLRERLGRLAAQPIESTCQTEGIRARGLRPPRRIAAAARRSGWVGER